MEAQLKEKLALASRVNMPSPLWNCVLIYTFLSGSRAYGTNDENSDYDLVSVFIAPPTYYLGLNIDKIPDAVEIKDIGIGPGIVMGIKYYELKHFIQLALKNNPNILEGLWADEENIIHHSDVISMFRETRVLFLSTEKARQAYKGYAFDQITKMMGSDIPTGRMGAKRKESLDKYGYDTKNAMHLFRLLYTVVDVIKYQSIPIKPKEEVRKVLLEVKSGRYGLDELNNKIVKLMKDVDGLMEDAKKHNMLLESQPRAIEHILVAALKKHFNWR